MLCWVTMRGMHKEDCAFVSGGQTPVHKRDFPDSDVQKQRPTPQKED